MSKTKGSKAERELFRMLWDNGWSVVRSAGSGCTQLPAPDLIAGNARRFMAIECKSTGDKKLYLSNYDIEQLKEFSDVFDARPWFAVKFAKKGWLFLGIEELEKTEKGYAIDLDRAVLRGISFEELINY